MTFYIIPEGRLGNNLFQFAFAIVLELNFPNIDIKIHPSNIQKCYGNKINKIIQVFPYIKKFIINKIKNSKKIVYSCHDFMY